MNSTPFGSARYKRNLSMVNEHIENAISELEQAREQAPMGTGMMIESAIGELERVKEAFDDE